MFLSSAEDFPDLIRTALPDEYRSVRINPEGFSDAGSMLAHVRTTDDGGKIVFVTNMGKETFTGTLVVFGEWERVLTADAETGRIFSADRTAQTGPLPAASVPLCLQPGKAIIFLLDPQ